MRPPAWLGRAAHVVAAVAVALATIPRSAAAFKPNDTGHSQATRDGLGRVSVKVTDECSAEAARLTFSAAAINAIVEADNKTDSLTDGFWHAERHFDNELFPESSARLRDIKESVIAKLLQDPPNVALARELFGGALHTLQDFYSHSNWAESHAGVSPGGLDGAAADLRNFFDTGVDIGANPAGSTEGHPGRIYAALGRTSLPSPGGATPCSQVMTDFIPLTGPPPVGEYVFRTALEGSAAGSDPKFDSDPSLHEVLTTGYYFGLNGCPDPGALAAGKCLHGMGTSATAYPCHGMAKDAPDAPSHAEARTAAALATADYALQVLYDARLRSNREAIAAFLGTDPLGGAGGFSAAPTNTATTVLRGGKGVYDAPRRTGGNHRGVDIVAILSSTNKEDYAVFAGRSGTVAFVRQDETPYIAQMTYKVPKKGVSPSAFPSHTRDEQPADGYGQTIVIDHGDGTYALYGHLATKATQALGLSTGQFVSAGTKIGYMADLMATPSEKSSGNVDAELVEAHERIIVHVEIFRAPAGARQGSAHALLTEIKGANPEYRDPTCTLQALGYMTN